MFRFLILAILMLCPGVLWAETKVPANRAEISLGFAPLVKQAAPAVVNIYARRVVETRQSTFSNDPFFEDFFRGFGAPEPRVQNSLGSGVILSGDGYVVSNFHVVGMATDIRVVLSDRREFSARVVLGDRERDLAILQLDTATDLPVLPLRDSDQVEVGELVLAIGNPFGIGQTVSSGIVSGLARSGAATGQARGYFIQTDAPINPGNSGGALIDVNGELIGINTSILSRSGGSNGIGFAIPANLVAEFVNQARQGFDSFQRPWAGMAGQPVDADLAASLALPSPDGLLISDLHPQSPFAVAGFRVGDVITKVGGLTVNSPSEMLFRMTVAGIGQMAQVTRVRGSRAEEIEVAMIPAPNDPPARQVVLSKRTLLPGARLAEANPMMIARFGLPLSLSGVIVTDPGRLGQRVGLQEGDVLIGVNRAQIRNIADALAALNAGSAWVRLEVMRKGQRLALQFRL